MGIQKKYLLFNIQFWLIYFVYEWLGNASVGNEYMRYLINASVIVPISFLAAIFTVHVLIEKYFLKNRKKAFWTGLVISVLVFIMIRRSFNYFYTYPLYYPGAQSTTSIFFPPKLIIEGVNIYLIVGVYTMFYFIRAWYEQQRITQMLHQDKISSELALLKLQVQPHFIFNTLNNIYSLALQKNDKTPDLIFRLSSFINYNLYDSKVSAIPVAKELEYIENYIELQKIRYGEKLDVALNVYHPVDNFMISPLLLLPLVENCFKHGLTGEEGQGWIRIDISVQKDWLILKIENSRVNNKNYHQQNGNGYTNGNGIGIDNVQRRLAIVYEGKHEFKYIDEQHSYLTVLKIKSL